jgi:hypothetical protein
MVVCACAEPAGSRPASMRDGCSSSVNASSARHLAHYFRVGRVACAAAGPIEIRQGAAARVLSPVPPRRSLDELVSVARAATLASAGRAAGGGGRRRGPAAPTCSARPAIAARLECVWAWRGLLLFAALASKWAPPPQRARRDGRGDLVRRPSGRTCCRLCGPAALLGGVPLVPGPHPSRAACKTMHAAKGTSAASSLFLCVIICYSSSLDRASRRRRRSGRAPACLPDRGRRRLGGRPSAHSHQPARAAAGPPYLGGAAAH